MRDCVVEGCADLEPEVCKRLKEAFAKKSGLRVAVRAVKTGEDYIMFTEEAYGVRDSVDCLLLNAFASHIEK